MTLIDVYGERRQAKVMQETWGHLAPKRSRSYKGSIVFALGCFGDLAVVEVDFAGLPDSPWFHEDMHRWIWDQNPEAGIYRFAGTYRRNRANQFVGDLQALDVRQWLNQHGSSE